MRCGVVRWELEVMTVHTDLVLLLCGDESGCARIVNEPSEKCSWCQKK